MRLTIVDAALRDGMHSVAHQFTPAQVAELAGALDGAGVDVIEVGHGDGLGGSSLQYGTAAASDEAYVEAAAGAVSTAQIAVLLLPGIGTVSALRRAYDLGARVARVATHCTEADLAQEHLPWAAEHDMLPVGFLMMSHMLAPAALVEQARMMQSYGAQVVYIVDSAGALVPHGVTERVAALVDGLECAVGFHGHNNLGCAVGNALAAADAGATWLDGSVRGFGAGAGNAQTEAMCAALERSGFETGVDLFTLMDAAEDIATSMLHREPLIDRLALSLGYAGVYSSFLLHAERAAGKYGVDAREVLLELGRRGMIGGQEDMIIGVAAEMAGPDSRRHERAVTGARRTAAV
jgi:4-hydroxy-2-oxovalerate aldolase